MTNSIKKNLRVLRELIRLRFQNLMMFRLDFFGPFFVDGSLFFIQLLVFNAVYSNVEMIGTWGRGEMIIYIGTFSLLNAISMTICFFGVNGIPSKVKSGEMDLYLSKPVSPLFRLTFENISPGSIPLIFMSIGIIVYGIKKSNIEITGYDRMIYIFWLAVMAILYYEMEVLIRSVSFYIVSTARMDQLEEAGLSLCMKLPGIAFYGMYKIIFYFILPYGIMATLPVQSLIGEMTLKIAGQGIGVIILFTILTNVVWKRGIKHYNSASS
jgi:ABC-2 type transport system permease protein